MADKTIGQLDPNPSIDGTEEKAIEKGGVNFKQTLEEEKTYILEDLSFVETVSGDGVDNTDPSNPVLSFPTNEDLAPTTETILINPLVFDKDRDYLINITVNTTLELSDTGNSVGVVFSMYRFNISAGATLSFGTSFSSELLNDDNFINSFTEGKINTVTFVWASVGIRRWSNQATFEDYGYRPEDSFATVEYWDFLDAVDSTDVTLTGKKGNVLTSNGYTKPTLSLGGVDFNGVNQAMLIDNTSIFDFMEPNTRKGQMHVVCNLKDAVATGGYQVFSSVSGSSFFLMTSVGNEVWHNIKGITLQDKVVATNWELGIHVHSFYYENGLGTYYYDGIALATNESFNPSAQAATFNALALGITPTNSAYTESSVYDLIVSNDPAEDFTNNMDYLLAKHGI